jgi:hypothetical protein
MHRFVLEQMGDFARAGETIEGPPHFRSWPDPDLPHSQEIVRCWAVSRPYRSMPRWRYSGLGGYLHPRRAPLYSPAGKGRRPEPPDASLPVLVTIVAAIAGGSRYSPSSAPRFCSESA